MKLEILRRGTALRFYYREDEVIRPLQISDMMAGE